MWLPNKRVNKRVVGETPQGWVVLSENGKELAGPYPTKTEAVKRLKQIDYYKKKKKRDRRAIDDVDTKPTTSMAEEAQRGLDWRREYGRGGTAVGIARARDIARRANLSPSTVKRMFSYFARHEVDKKGKGWSPGGEAYPSNGRIAWALWGGDPGQAWARKKVAQLERESE